MEDGQRSAQLVTLDRSYNTSTSQYLGCAQFTMQAAVTLNYK